MHSIVPWLFEYFDHSTVSSQEIIIKFIYYFKIIYYFIIYYTSLVKQEHDDTHFDKQSW